MKKLFFSFAAVTIAMAAYAMATGEYKIVSDSCGKCVLTEKVRKCGKCGGFMNDRYSGKQKDGWAFYDAKCKDCPHAAEYKIKM